jgi:hypothetical protein
MNDGVGRAERKVRTGLLRSLPLVSALLLAGVLFPAEASDSTATLGPVADTYVQADRATSNFGGLSSLRVDNSPLTNAYLRFDVSIPAGEVITKATLRIYARQSSTSGFTVHGVADTTWGERTTTYANAPAIGPSVGSVSKYSANAYASVDVTSLIKGSGPVSVALTRSSSTSNTYNSREAATNRPQLVIATAPAPTPPPTPQPTFPIRAAFYYPWFPEAWNQSGISPFTKYHPTLGFDSSTDDATRDAHLRALEYAKFNAGIYSWWGQGSKEDQRFPGMLARTAATGSPLKWALYYEKEGNGPDPAVTQITSDLDYIKSRYAADPGYLKVGGKPVIFVYANSADGCGMVDRWHQANDPTRDFYVVLKVFSGYRTCAGQPQSWHQYAPAVRTDHQASYSFSVSPEFDLTGPDPQRLPRDLTAFRAAVRQMVASGEPWQLVTTFNEWGENTATESAREWASPSGFGQYLDALRTNGK